MLKEVVFSKGCKVRNSTPHPKLEHCHWTVVRSFSPSLWQGPLGQWGKEKKLKEGKEPTQLAWQGSQGWATQTCGAPSTGHRPALTPASAPQSRSGSWVAPGVVSAGTLSMLAQRRSKDLTRRRAVRNAGKHFLCPAQVRSFPIGSLRHKREHLLILYAVFKTWPRAAVGIEREIHTLWSFSSLAFFLGKVTELSHEQTAFVLMWLLSTWQHLPMHMSTGKQNTPSKWKRPTFHGLGTEQTVHFRSSTFGYVVQWRGLGTFAWHVIWSETFSIAFKGLWSLHSIRLGSEDLGSSSFPRNRTLQLHPCSALRAFIPTPDTKAFSGSGIHKQVSLFHNLLPPRKIQIVKDKKHSLVDDRWSNLTLLEICLLSCLFFPSS